MESRSTKPSHPDLMTPQQVAHQLGLGLRCLSTMRTNCEGPPWTRLGNRVVYSKAELDRWLEGQFSETKASISGTPGNQGQVGVPIHCRSGLKSIVFIGCVSELGNRIGWSAVFKE